MAVAWDDLVRAEGSTTAQLERKLLDLVGKPFARRVVAVTIRATRPPLNTPVGFDQALIERSQEIARKN
jgi:hypothetical protein